jgi:hypothetical protein
VDEQEFLHKVSIKTNINIELLKDIYKNEELIALTKAGKSIEATHLLRSIVPRIGLREAKIAAELFIEENRQ